MPLTLLMLAAFMWLYIFQIGGINRRTVFTEAECKSVCLLVRLVVQHLSGLGSTVIQGSHFWSSKKLSWK